MAGSAPLTLMAVHAHPDDEATSTGGVLARYGAEGITTVLVTCTNGELGDAPGGIKPGEPGHDEATVARLRRAELEESCAVLGVHHLELLGYRDSGMMGWPGNDGDCFWQTPVAEAAGRLAVLVERYRPQVVLTYDANGFYGHPDHIQAHRITMAALEATDVVSKAYFPTVPRSRLAQFGEALAEVGVTLGEEAAGDPAEDGGPPPDFGSPDEEIAAAVDCSAVVERKLAALRAHASQAENVFFLRLPPATFRRLFAVEYFLQALDRTGSPLPEDDLFTGLR